MIRLQLWWIMVRFAFVLWWSAMKHGIRSRLHTATIRYAPLWYLHWLSRRGHRD